MRRQFSPTELVRSTRWTDALLGTYVLSLSFFEAIVHPALRQSGVRSVDILADVDGVAGALGEAGAREVGRSYGLHPIRVPSHVFHPKFLILDGPEGPSAVVGSGNLTFGGWGYNLELCEVLRPDRAGRALNDLANFLEELALTDRMIGTDATLLEPWIVRLRQVPPSGDTRIVHSVSTSISTQLADLPLLDGFEILLSEWVIGQHLYWAVGRSGDDTQRLRLMLDEGGWLAFSSYANANPTPNRLATLLSLAADAGIVQAGELNGERAYLPG